MTGDATRFQRALHARDNEIEPGGQRAEVFDSATRPAEVVAGQIGRGYTSCRIRQMSAFTIERVAIHHAGPKETVNVGRMRSTPLPSLGDAGSPGGRVGGGDERAQLERKLQATVRNLRRSQAHACWGPTASARSALSEDRDTHSQTFR